LLSWEKSVEGQVSVLESVGGGPFEEVAKTESDSLIVSADDPTVEYRWRVDSSNECGSTQSNIVTLPSLPLISPKYHNCGITWSPVNPDTYLLKIAEIPVPPCQATCFLSMQELIGKPFNLKAGQGIPMTLLEKNGRGESVVDRSVKVVVAPVAIGEVAVRKHMETVELYWEEADIRSTHKVY